MRVLKTWKKYPIMVHLEQIKENMQLIGELTTNSHAINNN